MNWAQFKDPVSDMCHTGAVVACWFITQEVGDLNTTFAKIVSTDFVDSLEFI